MFRPLSCLTLFRSEAYAFTLTILRHNRCVMLHCTVELLNRAMRMCWVCGDLWTTKNFANCLVWCCCASCPKLRCNGNRNMREEVESEWKKKRNENSVRFSSSPSVSPSQTLAHPSGRSFSRVPFEIHNLYDSKCRVLRRKSYFGFWSNAGSSSTTLELPAAASRANNTRQQIVTVRCTSSTEHTVHSTYAPYIWWFITVALLSMRSCRYFPNLYTLTTTRCGIIVSPQFVQTHFFGVPICSIYCCKFLPAMPFFPSPPPPPSSTPFFFLDISFLFYVIFFLLGNVCRCLCRSG